MRGNNRFIDAFHVFLQILDFLKIFHRQTIACSIRYVYHSSTGFNYSFNDPCQIFIICSPCVFCIKLNILNILFSIFHSSNSTLNNFISIRVEFIFNVFVTCTYTRMDALMLGILK